jgi:hypothetical protein
MCLQRLYSWRLHPRSISEMCTTAQKSMDTFTVFILKWAVWKVWVWSELLFVSQPGVDAQSEAKPCSCLWLALSCSHRGYRLALRPWARCQRDKKNAVIAAFVAQWHGGYPVLFRLSKRMGTFMKGQRKKALAGHHECSLWDRGKKNIIGTRVAYFEEYSEVGTFRGN